MLRPPREVEELNSQLGEAGRHVDPVLLERPLSYGKFVRDMADRGLVSFTLNCRCRLGLFFVYKKGKERIRLIQDCRSANRIFRTPLE